MDIDVKKLQDALTTVAEVCEQHVATATKHREIANSLQHISQTLSKLINEKAQQKQETSES
jgi:hypothetical protein